MMSKLEKLASETKLNQNLGSFVSFCEENGEHMYDNFIKRVDDGAYGICILEKRYLIENIEVVIRYYEKQIKDGITNDCYIAYGFDIFLFKS